MCWATFVMCWCSQLSLYWRVPTGPESGRWCWKRRKTWFLSVVILKKQTTHLIFLWCAFTSWHPRVRKIAISPVSVEGCRAVGMLSKRLAAVDIIYCHFEKSTGTNVAVIAVLLYRCLFFFQNSECRTGAFVVNHPNLATFIYRTIFNRASDERPSVNIVRPCV